METRRHWMGAVAALLSFAAAGGIGAAKAESLTVYWNAGHSYKAYADAIKGFEQANPGWSVRWEKFQWPDMRTKLIADFSVKNPPDLSAEPGGWVQEFAVQGLLRPLDDFVAKDGREIGFPDDWQGYTIDRNRYQGKQYGVQLHLTCAALLYNVDMLKEAGFSKPPATWQEFREVAKATAKPGKFGFAPNPTFYYYWAWLQQNGAKYYDPTTNTVTLDTPEAAEALQFLADLIHVDKAAPVPVAGADYEGPQKLFTANRAAMIITGPWDVAPILQGNPKLNWAVAPALTNKTQSTFFGGVSLMIPATAKYPDKAWDLLKRFVALDTELAATKEAGMTMPRKSWAAHADVKADKIIAPFSQCLPYAQEPDGALRQTGKWARVNELLQNAFDATMYKKVPAKDALKQFVAEANAVLAQK
ncbi:MAG: sugar ABC transporter substrate-binding protein [Microvirga sp.]|jgi:multiple sugar transport system substrate-binding protein